MQVTSSTFKPRPYYHSSSFKMAMLFTLLLSISGGLIGYFLYQHGQETFIREIGITLDTEIDSIRQWSDFIVGKQSLASFIQDKSQQGHVQFYYLLSSSEGEVKAGNLSSWPAQFTNLNEGMIRFEYSGKILAAKTFLFDDEQVLLVARDIQHLINLRDNTHMVSFLSVVFMLVVVLTSFFISMFVVKRIDSISQVAHDIVATGELDKRIEIDSRWDDLSNMAAILNQLFERNEELMQGIRQVSNNIAHDLRTPLTRILHKLEQMQANKLVANNEDLQEQFDQVTREARQLLDTFSAVLRITNIEQGRKITEFGNVCCHTLIEDVIEMYEPVASDKNVSLSSTLIGDPIPIQGDKNLLFQAFTNVVDNAIKYSNQDGFVSVSVEPSIVPGKKVKIIVKDTGIGVKGEELDKIFNRFYRAEKSRCTKGTGLGLSMVDAVIKLHSGRIIASHNEPQGLIMTIQL